MRINDKTLKRIKHQLNQDGVWISPGLRDKFNSRVERHLEKAVAGHRPPVKVALIKVPGSHPRFKGDIEALFASLRKDVATRGTYIGVDGSGGGLRVVGYSFGKVQTPFYATESARLRSPDDIAQQVVDTARLTAGGKARKVYKRLNKPDRDAEQNGSREQGSNASGEQTTPPKTSTPAAEPSGQPSSTTEDSGAAGITLGIGIIVVLALAAVGVAWLLRRARRTGGPSRLPGWLPSLPGIPMAERRRREKRARRELTALGQRIESTTSLQAHDSWQQAVEHHTIARRLLDGPHSSADTVGVIVLTARGESALDAAIAGRDWEPTPRCYLNPLHGDAVRTVSWRGVAAGVDVPACAACADAIGAGHMPDDVLDFPYDGRPRHYFALEIEPWTSTGYGSLELDLIGRLKGRRAAR